MEVGMRTRLCALLVALGCASAWAQYPAKPVRMLVGFAPGGGVDITARLVAQKLTERWGKPVVVENRSGAAGNIATEIVAKSAPDGHTLLMAFSSHASKAALYEKLPFDIARDFTPVSGLPRPVADRLTREITAIVTTPETSQSMLEQGSIVVAGGPEELDALVRREYALWSKVVKAGNVRPE